VSGWRIAESVVLTPLRLALGGLFIYAGVLKALDPQAFAFAIKGYGVLDAGDAHAIRVMAYTIPWAEILTGVLLVIGGWARGAALLLAVQLALFTAANAVVLDKGIECSCFGENDPFCSGPIGQCHMIRNGVMLAASALLAWRGAGLWSVDETIAKLRAAARRREVDTEGESA